MMERRQEDWAELALGGWLVISPFVLQYSNLAGAAAINSYVIGVLITAFAAGALTRPQMWEEAVNFVLGLWLLLSPMMLGFTGDNIAHWNHVIVGLLICADATWNFLQYPPTSKPA